MKKFLKILIVIAILIAVVIFGTKMYFSSTSGKTMKADLVKKGASQVISQMTGNTVDVQNYMDEHMDAEDAAYVDELLEDKVDIDAIQSVVTQYQVTGEVQDSVVESLQDSLTEADQEKIKTLYDKYGDDFVDYISVGE